MMLEAKPLFDVSICHVMSHLSFTNEIFVNFPSSRTTSLHADVINGRGKVDMTRFLEEIDHEN